MNDWQSVWLQQWTALDRTDIAVIVTRKILCARAITYEACSYHHWDLNHCTIHQLWRTLTKEILFSTATEGGLTLPQQCQWEYVRVIAFAYSHLTDRNYIVLAARLYWSQCMVTACRRETQAAQNEGVLTHEERKEMNRSDFRTPVVEFSSARIKKTYSCPGSSARFSNPPYSSWSPRVKKAGRVAGVKRAVI